MDKTRQRYQSFSKLVNLDPEYPSAYFNLNARLVSYSDPLCIKVLILERYNIKKCRSTKQGLFSFTILMKFKENTRNHSLETNCEFWNG